MCNLILRRDQRNTSAPLRSFLESHTDTITSLQLHPTLPTLLLSSSTDGLVNIFDTSQADEDDALYQVINHGSAIAHAGFMYPSTDVFALGTDETMSFYALQSQKEEEEEPSPKAFGDMREPLSCEYVAKMHWINSQPVIATGKHRWVLLVSYLIGECLQRQRKPYGSCTCTQGRGCATVRLQPYEERQTTWSTRRRSCARSVHGYTCKLNVGSARLAVLIHD